MYKSVTIAQADLIDPATAPRDIDRVLKECWIKSRPVYIQLPTDMVTKVVDGTALKEPIDLAYPPNDHVVEADVVSRILQQLYSAKRACILVDGCVLRHKVCLAILNIAHLLNFDFSLFQRSTPSSANPSFPPLSRQWAKGESTKRMRIMQAYMPATAPTTLCENSWNNQISS